MIAKPTQTMSVVAGLCTCLAGLAYGQSQPVKRETTVTKETTRNGVTVGRTVQRSTEVLGVPITSQKENIGKVEDLVVDVNTGRVVYGVGSFTTVPGATGKLYPIPWPAGTYSTETRTYNIDVDAARLQTAPSFTTTEWPNFADETFATRTFQTYNQTPYWKTERTVVRTADPARPATTVRERWTQAPTTTYRISELRGKTIRTSEGATLGQINEVVLDPQTGRILYAVVSRDGTFVPVPWSALRYANNDFQITITADQWKNAPVIKSESWTTLTEPQYVREVHHYYKVKHDHDDDDDDDDD